MALRRMCPLLGCMVLLQLGVLAPFGSASEPGAPARFTGVDMDTVVTEKCVSMLQSKALFHDVASSKADPKEVAPKGARGGFAEHCQLYPGKRVVLVTVNMDYLDMFRNWLHFATPFLTSTEQLRVVAEEAKVVAPLKEMQKTHGFDLVTPQAVTQTVSLLEGPYESPEFVGVVGKRPSRMLEALDAGCSVLYVDVDTAWAQDPFLGIGEAGEGDVYVTDDVPSPDYCTCFLYMNPSPASRSFTREWEKRMGRSMDQPIFNQVMREVKEHTAPASYAALSHIVLPREKYPSGLLGAWYQNASVWHANWKQGKAKKIKFLKRKGFWVD